MSPDGNILRGSKNQKGYILVEIGSRAKGRKRICKTVHTIVAETFIGKRPSPKHQINHINGDKENNSSRNLEYITCRENIIHCHKKHLHKNRLHPKIVKSIYRSMSAGKRDPKGIAVYFGISTWTAKAILSGERWKFITGAKGTR